MMSLIQQKSCKVLQLEQPDLLKALATLLDTTVRESAIYQEDLKPYWKSEIDHTLRGNKQGFYFIYKFSKHFTTQEKMTTKVVVFLQLTSPKHC